LRKALFAVIGYADSESTGPRTRPDCATESQRFRIQLRKTSFLNLHENNRQFESLGGDKLSEEMKKFSITARARRINYIKEKLTLTKPSGFFRPIPVTFNEMQLQSAESSMKKEELIVVIETLIGSLNETNRIQFQGLKSKRKDELLVILQQIRDLLNMTNSDEVEDTI
jgi:hypothetical protein